MTVLPRDGAWTVADLALLPDDGLRYELVDGTLLVSAVPSKLHQRVLGNLYLALRAACPAHLEVFSAPTDYQPTQTRSLQPDLLVVSRDDPGPGAVTTPLALAVEVLSPLTRSVDLLLKRELYRQAGVFAHWVVDPVEPSVEVVELLDGGWGRARRAAGTDSLQVSRPYALTVVPADLLR